MKLYYTPTSPYVRKVCVAARELGIDLETEFLRPSPMKCDPTLSTKNPLSKIPTLVLDDGTTLFDSPVICEYLDADNKLIPARGPERFRVLKTQALSDGVLDAAVLVFYEERHRPKDKHWQDWLDGQLQKAEQGLAELASMKLDPGDVNLGSICVATMLGWLEFRKLVEFRHHESLAAFYDAFTKRPSMHATIPHD